MQSRRFSVIRIISVLPVILALLAAVPQAAYSAPANAKLAVVDLQRIMGEAKVTASIQDQLNKQRAAYQTEISKLEQELKNTESQLEKDTQSQKNSGDLIQKKADFEKKVIESKKLVQQRRNGLEKGATDAMNEVRKEVLKIISEMSEKEKYDAVLTQQAVIFSSKSLDITDAVLKSLNSRLSKVTVKFENN